LDVAATKIEIPVRDKTSRLQDFRLLQKTSGEEERAAASAAASDDGTLGGWDDQLVMLAEGKSLDIFAH